MSTKLSYTLKINNLSYKLYTKLNEYQKSFVLAQLQGEIQRMLKKLNYDTSSMLVCSQKWQQRLAALE